MWGMSYITTSIRFSSFLAAEHDSHVLLCDFGRDVGVVP